MASKLGVNTTALVSCKKSEHHGFHPADELCRYCDPPALERINVKINSDREFDAAAYAFRWFRTNQP